MERTNRVTGKSFARMKAYRAFLLGTRLRIRLRGKGDVKGGFITTGDWEFNAIDAAQAHAARRAFRKYLDRTCVPASNFVAAEMIFGELVGNVIRHAPGAISIGFEWNSDGALLRVTDSGSGFRERYTPPPIDKLPTESSEHGRGLFLVSQLSESITISCRRDGCEIRVLLPVARRSEYDA